MEFHFLRPYWFLLLLPALLFLWLRLKNSNQASGWSEIIDPKLLPYLFTKKDFKRQSSFLWLVFIAWLVAIFALAGPTWQKRDLPVYINHHAKVIVLDLSQSMLAQDIKPSRIARARYKILDILKHFPEGQTGLVAFSSEAYTVSPLTNDTHTIALMVPDLSPNIMPVQGSNIGAGLRKAEELLRQGEAMSGNIILITDSKPDKKDDVTAQNIHKAGYDISVLAIGTTGGAPIPLSSGNFEQMDGQTVLAKVDISALKTLAQDGGGRFSAFSNTDADIESLLKPTLKLNDNTTGKLSQSSLLWYDEGRWFILLLLPFALILFRRGFRLCA